jgi:hypothetical protein
MLDGMLHALAPSPSVVELALKPPLSGARIMLCSTDDMAHHAHFGVLLGFQNRPMEILIDRLRSSKPTAEGVRCNPRVTGGDLTVVAGAQSTKDSPPHL